MTNKLLIVVDMQNDFINGSLANEHAKHIIPNVVDFINKWDGKIIATCDTHYTKDYLDFTLEGRLLPVEHCIENTYGWQYDEAIEKALIAKEDFLGYVSKYTFGSLYMLEYIEHLNVIFDEIVLIGVCTDICVVSNALLLRAKYPNTVIKVVEDCCAGVTKAKHDAALETMRSCQIEVL